MLFDKSLMLSEGQTLTADAAGTDGTNAIALELGGDDYNGKDWIVGVVKTAFTVGGTADPTGAEIEVKIQSCDVKDFSTGSPTIYNHGSFKLGSSSNVTGLTKGTMGAIRMPLGLHKYVRCYFDVTLTGGTSPTITGRLDVGVTDGVQTA